MEGKNVITTIYNEVLPLVILDYSTKHTNDEAITRSLPIAPGVLEAAFEICTCPVVWDNQNSHWTSRNERSSCLMNKQETVQVLHKLHY